ncbi:hypothetical protein [Kitasatospora sp. McL0602]|uniref:hypothetical protein n=1 Tax=Kitasatospora sp. McL0602 TaxID=3439530 RepID=UPI003F8B2C9C
MSVEIDAPRGEFEDAFVRSLSETVEGFETDAEPLIASGLAIGRRTRRRRRATAGAAALVVLVAVGGALTTGLPGSRSAVAPAAPSPSAATSEKLLSPEALISNLRRLLPHGAVTAGAGRVDDPGVSTAARYDDGHGVAGLTLSVLRYDVHRASQLQLCGEGDTCQTGKLPDGSTYTLVKRKPVGVLPLDWSAELIGPDGRLVTLHEYNAPDDQGTPATRAEPPLTLQQLTDVVADPAWSRIALAVPAAQAVRQHGTVSGQQILDTLARLLPAGLTRRTVESNEGFASLTLDDGHGRRLVQMNAEDWGDTAAHEHTDEPTEVLGWQKLPDGTRITTTEGPDTLAEGGKHLVLRAVQVLRPDGLRIAITAINSPSHGQSATRPDPALTLDQLKTIALSPEWKLTYEAGG